MVVIFECQVLLKMNTEAAPWVSVARGTECSDVEGSDAGTTVVVALTVSSKVQISALHWNMASGARPKESLTSCFLLTHPLLAPNEKSVFIHK